MGMMTVRNIPDEVHNALKARAKRNNRSTEAEVRAILEEVTRAETGLQMGDALSALGHRIGLADDDFDLIGQVRDTAPAKPMKF
jgi:plasmid stability protein